MRWIADENLDNDILRAWARRQLVTDVVRVQDVGLNHQPDPAILDWAAREQRIVLTHDAATMPDHAWARVAAGMPMPGLVVVKHSAPRARVVDHLVLLDNASHADEWADRVLFLPFV